MIGPGRLCMIAVPGLLAGSSAPAQPNAAHARMVTIDGHAMRVQTIGLEQRKPQSPIIVLEAGVTHSLDAWLTLPAHLAAIAPVIEPCLTR